MGGPPLPALVLLPTPPPPIHFSLSLQKRGDFPWVSTILSGIPEMAEDGQCGLLAKPGDAKDLADKIEELIVNKNKRLEMGKKCFDTVREKYTIVKICDKIENCYQ